MSRYGDSRSLTDRTSAKPQASDSAGSRVIADETSQADGHRAATPPHDVGPLRTDPGRNAQAEPKIRTASDDFEQRGACLLNPRVRPGSCGQWFGFLGHPDRRRESGKPSAL